MKSVDLCFLQRAREFKKLSYREVSIHGAYYLADSGGELHDDGRRCDLVHDGAHEFLLPRDSSDIALFVTVADIAHGGDAVHVLHAGVQVDDEAARYRVIPFINVVHALFYVYINAADGVNDAREGAGVDGYVVVNGGIEEILHR